MSEDNILNMNDVTRLTAKAALIQQLVTMSRINSAAGVSDTIWEKDVIQITTELIADLRADITYRTTDTLPAVNG